MSCQENNFYVFDYETTSFDYYKKHGYTKVWLWGVANGNGEFLDYGTNIESSIIKMWKLTKKNTIFYFHNLKFDFSFILAYLFENGFQHKEKVTLKDKKCFSTLIGKMGQVYSITIIFRNKKIEILDSLKLINCSVEKMAKDFNLPIKKGKIDYEDYTVTNEKIEYVKNDVCIVATVLAILKKGGMNKMTSSSSAYFLLKESVKNFDKLFPKLPIELLDIFRLAYRGGRCHVNPIYQGKILKNVYRYDENSMYPNHMANGEIPYGKPKEIKEGDLEKYRFSIIKCNMWIKLKNKKIPSLLKKQHLITEQSYYIESDCVEEFVISNIDLELTKRNYDIIYFEFVKAWGFNTKKGIFTDYILKLYEEKKNEKGAKKEIIKRKLNQPTGKFGSKHRIISKIPTYEEKLSFYWSEEQIGKSYYLPVVIQITSLGHLDIDNAIQSVGYENFVYCDTDSVHSLTEMTYNVGYGLGEFKLEAVEAYAKYVRQKTYITKENGYIHVTGCGMNDEVKHNILNLENPFSAFELNLEVDGKKLLKQVKGGCVLYNGKFKIRK